ncbi:hypothetical protein R69619_03710 [Paraburkholderia nemoris]|nr:hypothetical protein R69619_03710 [Paraburkholderia nemoris]
MASFVASDITWPPLPLYGLYWRMQRCALKRSRMSRCSPSRTSRAASYSGRSYGHNGARILELVPDEVADGDDRFA